MLANLPVEVILLICQYPESKELKQLAWTNKRIMQIIKEHLPMALERRILFYLCHRSNSKQYEGRIGLFNSSTCSVEEIAQFQNCYWPFQATTTKNKIFGIDDINKSFEIFDLDTRQISTGSTPPEWREFASIAYYKDKLYHLGGEIPKSEEYTNRIDVLIDGNWQTGLAFPLPIRCTQATTCDGILYVIDGDEGKKIYRLSDDERKWVEIGEIPERRDSFGVASLNGRIYITGGDGDDIMLKSCLCFDSSAPVNSRVSRIANMNYGRYHHSLIAANGKLYAIGGYQKYPYKSSCNSIEEYDPQTNKWREVGKLRNLAATSESAGKKTLTNGTNKDCCLLS